MKKLTFYDIYFFLNKKFINSEDFDKIYKNFD